MNYAAFLKSKIDIAPDGGFDVEPEELNPVLLPHQRDAVLWALKGGRRGIDIELNAGYFLDGCNYLKVADEQKSAPTLFDFLREGA